MGYVYRGENKPEPVPVRAKRKPKQGAYDPAVCGTMAGAERHRSRREKFCPPCLDEARRPPTPARFTTDRCGTPAGLQRHYAYKTLPCRPCLAAKQLYDKARKEHKALHGGRVRVLRPCGTYAAYVRHLRAGEPACGACAAANAAKSAAGRGKKSGT